MKIILFFLLILVSQQGLTCSCAADTPLANITRSEFVATVKILNVTPDTQNKHYNDVDIEILDLYKGNKISSLKNYGIEESTCGIYTPKDTTWLIYAYRHIDGYLRYDLCTDSKQLDKKINFYNYPNAEIDHKKPAESNLELLEYLKKENIHLNDEYGLRTHFSNECLKDFNGIEVQTHRFALYELTIDNLLNIKIIKSLKEFDNENLQENLLSCVNKSVKVYKKHEQIQIPENTKIIVGLFYNPAVDGEESFIDQWGLGF